MRQKLALLLLLTLATIYPVPSCNYDTYAQEPGDIFPSEQNAGLAPMAVGDIAYRSLDDLIKAKSAGNFYFYADQTGTGLVEEYKRTYRYDFLLKDVADDDGYDSWFYYGCLIAYVIPDNGASYSWRRFVFSGELHKMSTGAWAVKRYTVTFGLPGYTGTNVYGVTYDEGANFFEQYVAALQKDAELNGKTFNPAGQYDNYINWETHDTDAGGVNNLAEWVRGTAINDVYDDKPSLDPECKCGACCSCECVCGHWSGDVCPATPDACACHQPKCTCADYCCYDKCGCEVCDEGEHAEHQNGAATCDGTIGDTIGFVGCSCHGDDAPEKECACANYCCYHTCECEKCGDGVHAIHENGFATCDNTDGESGCACHKEDDSDECACANYCCRCVCECQKCGDGAHDAHKNDNGECDGTFANCSECHKEDDSDECTCVNYCCYHTCKCKRCASLPAASHSAHKNGFSTCNGAIGSGGCACHDGSGDDEECTCANYCCYHTCKCKRCASLPAASHSQHKNGSPTCTGATGSGGCSCHETSYDPDDEVKPPTDQDFNAPTEEKKDSFLPYSKLQASYDKLKNKLSIKFGIERLTNFFTGDLSGELPTWSIALPAELGGSLELDLNVLLDYSVIKLTRGVLTFLVYFFTAITVFNSLRRLL